MVKLFSLQRVGYGDNPPMPVHILKATKKTKCFKPDEEARCFIIKMDNDRYAVTDADFSRVTPHYEVFGEKELHESFTEL